MLLMRTFLQSKYFATILNEIAFYNKTITNKESKSKII